VCAPPDDANWFTCPCQGFEFGEQGELDLVRLRASNEVDRLPLIPLFRGAEPPPEAAEENHAALRRWPVLESDLESWMEAERRKDPAALEAFEEALPKRKPLDVLDVGDFNRDGLAAEFVLQIGALPCGKRQSVLVGI
jgi:hypothetical protein